MIAEYGPVLDVGDISAERMWCSKREILWPGRVPKKMEVESATEVSTGFEISRHFRLGVCSSFLVLIIRYHGLCLLNVSTSTLKISVIASEKMANCIYQKHNRHGLYRYGNEPESSLEF